MSRRIDTHVHLFDPFSGNYAWPAKTEMFYRRYDAKDFDEAAKGYGFDGLVIIGCSSEPEMTESILKLYHDCERVSAIVGQIDFANPEFARVFENGLRYEKFRGFRAGGLKNPLSEAAKANLKRMEGTKANIVELLTGQQELYALEDVFAAYPGVKFIIEHFACEDIDGNEPSERFVRFLRDMAAYPNVYFKASSALLRAAVKPAPTDVQYYLPMLRVCAREFGDRAMFGTDWPVLEMRGAFSTAAEPALLLEKELGEAGAGFLGENAARVYDVK